MRRWSFSSPLIAANPELPDARYQAALAAQMTGVSAKASSLAAEALSRGEDGAPLQMLIGFIAMQEKKHAEALSAFKRAAQLDPEDCRGFL
jgi:Flp pilus assembly protein TadD